MTVHSGRTALGFPNFLSAITYVKCILLVLTLSSSGMLMAQESITPVFREKVVPPADRSKFHVYLLAGQSNMAGRGIVESQDTVGNPRILRLNREGEWEIAKDPLHFDKPAVGVGLGLSFAREMLSGNEDIIIGLIPCAVGGSSIDDWKPGVYYRPTESYPCDDALRRARTAMLHGTLKGILWHQGESDCLQEKAAEYREKLVALVNRLRDELQAPDVPFVAGEIPAFQNRDRYINPAFREAKQQIRNCETVSAQGLTVLSDSVHLDAASQREFGKRYAVAMLSLQAACERRNSVISDFYPDSNVCRIRKDCCQATDLSGAGRSRRLPALRFVTGKNNN